MGTVIASQFKHEGCINCSIDYKRLDFDPESKPKPTGGTWHSMHSNYRLDNLWPSSGNHPRLSSHTSEQAFDKKLDARVITNTARHPFLISHTACPLTFSKSSESFLLFERVSFSPVIKIAISKAPGLARPWDWKLHRKRASPRTS